MNQFIENLITQIDAFGVPIQLRYKNKTQYQSMIGGIFSLIIYGTSLAYAIMVLAQWNSGNILAKTQTQTTTIEQTIIELEKGFFQIGIFNASKNDINPFRNESNIILPLLIGLVNTEYMQPIPIFSSSIKSYYDNSTRDIIQLNKMNLSFSRTSGFAQRQYFLVLVKCTQQYIAGHGTCASDDEINNYINNLPGILDLTINIKQFNPFTQSFDQITKSQYLAIENISSLYTQIQFQVTKMSLNVGFLFDSIQNYTFINNYEINNQLVTKQYSHKLLNQDTLAIIFLRLDTLQIESQVVYPKIGEIFAQIGSIVQMLLMTKIIFTKLNTKFLEKEIKTRILQIYYSNQKKTTNKVETIECQNKINNNQLDKDSFKRLEVKFDLLNIIYQIITLQQLLQEFNDLDKLQLSIQSRQQQIIEQNKKKSQIIPLSEDNEEDQLKMNHLHKEDLIDLFDYKY
ncbi:hypothetical protein pb186bvf_006569 [Paramecium bursaria]